MNNKLFVEGVFVKDDRGDHSLTTTVVVLSSSINRLNCIGIWLLLQRRAGGPCARNGVRFLDDGQFGVRVADGQLAIRRFPSAVQHQSPFLQEARVHCLLFLLLLV